MRVGCANQKRCSIRLPEIFYRPLFRFLRRRFQRIQTGTAAKCLVKRRAEMAQAVVADFQRGLGDVVFAGHEQFRRAFHAELAQMLCDGVAGLRGKNPAQIKMAAADFPPSSSSVGGAARFCFNKKITCSTRSCASRCWRVQNISCSGGGWTRNVTASSSALH